MPAKLVQRRRGTTANHSVFAGAEGEITQDTTKNTLVSHDGNTQGGHPLAKEDMSNVSGNASGGGVGIAQLNVIDGTSGQVLKTDGAGNMSFQSIDVNANLQLGGDLSGLLGNAQIITNAIGINELNVTAPTISGQVLSSDVSGNLEFITPATNMNLVGDISGTFLDNQITSQAVGTPELATNAVTTVKISDLNVTSGKIADGSITSNKLAGMSVTTDKITDGNITLAKMADNSVRTGNIIDANVTTAKLANNSVGITQLNVNDGSNGQVLSTDGSGVLSFTSLALGGDLTGTTDNAVIAAGAIEDSMIVGISAAKIIGGSGLTGMQVFDTPGAFTWTKTAGVKSILYFVTGGGQGGQGGITTAAGVGGRSSSTVMGFLDVSTITNENGVVGAGGGGSTGGATGGGGQDSTFGTHATGQANAAGIGGQVRMAGVAGDKTDHSIAPSGGLSGGGKGGVSFWGGGPGRGGSGTPVAPASGSNQYPQGEQGADGIVIIIEFA